MSDPADSIRALLDTLPPRAVVSSARAGRRLELARAWLAERDALAAVLVLGASRRAADDLVRLGLGGGARLGVLRSTPVQLATELAAPSLADRQHAPLAGLASQALVVRTVHAVLDEGSLVRFGEVARLPGFARALGETLSELRLGDVDPGSLAAIGDQGRDLQRLLERYGSELERWSVADLADVYRAAVAALREAPSRLSHPALWLDLRPRQPLEVRFLEELGRQSTELLVTVAAEQEDGRTSAATAERLDAQWLDLDRIESDSGSRLERVQRYVFSPEVPAADDREEDESVHFFSASSEGQECVEIARRLRDLAAQGISFDDTAILLRNPTTYLPLFEEALGRAGIPAFFSRGTARPDPAGRAFLALLGCAADGLSATGFAEYLSLGQVPVLDAAARPPEVEEVPWVEPEADQFVFKSLLPSDGGDEDVGPQEEIEADEPEEEGPAVAGTLPLPQRWERLLVDASVVGGQERWRRRLEGLEEELRLRLREVEGEDDHRAAAISREIEQLGNLEGFALPLIEDLSALPEGERWGQWIEQLERLAVRSLRRPESVLEVLADLRPMSEVGPISLEQVQQTLNDRLTLLRREPPRRRFGRVFVATLEEAIGRSFEVVFLPGLAEGIFPRRSKEDPLLLDEMRRCIDEELPTQDQRVRDERYLLHLGVGAARRRLVLSYPRIDVAQGRQRVPSFYALDLLRAAEGTLPDLRELQQRASSASATLMGWPAPKRVDDAIDDAEYDLAVLLPLLQRPAADTRGEGQFLLRTNACLARSLRSRARRWRKLWTSVDGLVEPGEEGQAALAEHRVDRRSFSPTALQHYASCPYRFFLQALVRLRPRDELETLEQMDPLTRGSLFHEVQFELFSELRDAELLPVREETLASALDCLDRVLDRCATRYEERLAPAIPRIWKSEIESLRNDLRGWIRHVAERDARWVPRWSELAFGLPLGPDRDAQSSPEPATVLDGASLRGSIDLVEVHADGHRLRVTDHKTGRVARDWDGRVLRDGGLVVAGGRVLQPVLYALAAESLVGGSESGYEVEAGRLFYSTQRGEYTTLGVPLDERARSSARSVLESVDEAVERGFLPAAPAEGECRWCDYRLVCGPYEELRTRRKPEGGVEPLVHLRGLR